ncbi:ribbon-helix-helix protein, CopG family [Candidatus Soleaferrea massiliensis]|uniref:ribbon-helix-helix protein, CopG family n=1 Tax=Candidatus Soleaferrea massiliensis TaxID=1470354 RepID=UPI00058E4F5E|nr:ribbon-helix-helix protein, CopG family [Candidatus Soleaferrea massiliensis]
MSEKKMGRPPSDNPLSERIYLRVDKETKEILDECVKKLDSSRSDVVRKGIYLVRDDLNKK